MKKINDLYEMHALVKVMRLQLSVLTNYGLYNSDRAALEDMDKKLGEMENDWNEEIEEELKSGSGDN